MVPPHFACMRGVWSREKRVQTGSACSLLWRVARKHAERKVLCIGKQHYFIETAPRNMICKICMVWDRVVFFYVFKKGLETIGGGVGMRNKSNYWNVQIIKIPNFSWRFHGLPTVNFSAREIYKEQTGLGTYDHPPFPCHGEKSCRMIQSGPWGRFPLLAGSRAVASAHAAALGPGLKGSESIWGLTQNTASLVPFLSSLSPDG